MPSNKSSLYYFVYSLAMPCMHLPLDLAFDFSSLLSISIATYIRVSKLYYYNYLLLYHRNSHQFVIIKNKFMSFAVNNSARISNKDSFSSFQSLFLKRNYESELDSCMRSLTTTSFVQHISYHSIWYGLIHTWQARMMTSAKVRQILTSSVNSALVKCIWQILYFIFLDAYLLINHAS